MLWAEEEQIKVTFPPIFGAVASTPLTGTWPQHGLWPTCSPQGTGHFSGYHRGRNRKTQVDTPRMEISPKRRLPSATCWDGDLLGTLSIEALRWEIFKLGSPG